jgi:hypothetical protein
MAVWQAALLLPLHTTGSAKLLFVQYSTIATPRTARRHAAPRRAARTWSPSTGAPRLFIATRIWCVRPVSGFSKKARIPGRLPGTPAVVNLVTAGSAPPRVSSQLPRRPFAISPTTLPIFLAGRLSERAT